MTTPFVVFALPRSRTTWLAAWLKGGHDLMPRCDSMAEYIAAIQRRGGTVETAGMVAWRTLRKAMPHARFVTIRRPVAEVCASLERQQWKMTPGLRDELQARASMLDEIEAAGAKSFRFDEISRPTVAALLWREVKPGRPFDYTRWSRIDAQKINTDVAAENALFGARLDRIRCIVQEAQQLDQELQAMEA